MVWLWAPILTSNWPPPPFSKFLDPPLNCNLHFLMIQKFFLQILSYSLKQHMNRMYQNLDMQNKRNDFSNLFSLCWFIPYFNGLVQSSQTIDAVQPDSRRFDERNYLCQRRIPVRNLGFLFHKGLHVGFTYFVLKKIIVRTHLSEKKINDHKLLLFTSMEKMLSYNICI